MKIRSVFLSVLFAMSFGRAQENTDNLSSFRVLNLDATSITLERGISYLKTLDRRFALLSKASQITSAKNYALNRNRLFILNQEKRLDKEIQELVSAQKSPILINEKRKNLRKLSVIRTSLFTDEKLMSSRLIINLNDLMTLYQVKTGKSPEGNLGFSQSYSKRSRGSGSSGFSDSYSKRYVMELLDEEISRMTSNRAGPHEKLEETIISSSRLAICRGEVDTNKPAKYLDPRLFPKESKFLNELGISSWSETAKAYNLSHLYGEPTTQFDVGNIPNASCVGHAISSDIASVINSKNNLELPVVSLSPEQTHAVIKTIEMEPSRNLTPLSHSYCDSASYGVDPYGSVMSITGALNNLKNNPVCTNTPSDSPDSPSLFSVNKFSFLEYDEANPADSKIGYDFFRMLIDNGHPPMVAIDSDKRQVTEDWISIQSGGMLKHILNVVGYGEDMDPQTLCNRKYLLVRDSVSKNKIYHKIPAANLFAHIVGIYKITEVKEVRPTPSGNSVVERNLPTAKIVR